MASRDQSFNDRASAFWGHHRLVVEQFAGIPGQRKLRLKLGDALAGSRQFIGLHTGDAIDHSRIDQRLALSPEQRGLRNARFSRDGDDRLARSQTLSDLPPHRSRIPEGHVTSC
jgi:hypothetical protein